MNVPATNRRTRASAPAPAPAVGKGEQGGRLDPAYRLVDQPPVLCRLAHQAIAHQVPGAWKFLSLVREMTLRKTVVAHRLDGVRPVTLYLPLFRAESCKPLREIDHYERVVIDNAVALLTDEQASASATPLWFVDAGADIGMVSAQMIRRLDRLVRVFAFEPNPVTLPFLQATLASSGITHDIMPHAVGAQNATGRMVTPPDDPSEHARFFQPDPNGPVRVQTIDSLPSPAGHQVVLKIDVEGNEADVIAGAARFLAAAASFVVIFEAHPGVMARTGVGPGAILQRLNAIKPCRAFVAGDQPIPLDHDQAIEPQIPDFESRVHNIICHSIGGLDDGSSEATTPG
ncbi:MAG: FkbM family methyltransferase [Pseudomonadota bacterium]